jgi:hypothetical protein
MLIRLKSLKSFIIIISIWSSLLMACDPCAECGKPLVFDPTVAFKFINWDSLVTTSALLDTTNIDYDSLSDFRDSLRKQSTFWETQLEMLRDSIEDGKDQYVDDTVKYDDSLKSALNQILYLDTAITETNLIKSDLTQILTTIESGKVRLDKVTIDESGNSVEYADSATLYNLPLLMQDYDMTTFLIDLDGKRDTIVFSYITDIDVDTERKVKLRAYNIDTVSYTYDSLLFECNTSQCLSNEVLVTVYF